MHQYNTICIHIYGVGVNGHMVVDERDQNCTCQSDSAANT